MEYNKKYLKYKIKYLKVHRGGTLQHQIENIDANAYNRLLIDNMKNIATDINNLDNNVTSLSKNITSLIETIHKIFTTIPSILDTQTITEEKKKPSILGTQTITKVKRTIIYNKEKMDKMSKGIVDLRRLGEIVKKKHLDTIYYYKDENGTEITLGNYSYEDMAGGNYYITFSKGITLSSENDNYKIIYTKS